MKTDTALVFYYSKPNRFSINVLVGTLERDPYFKDLAMYFFKTPAELVKGIADLSRQHLRVLLSMSFSTLQLWETHKLLTAVKENHPNEFTCIAGGPHATGDPEGTLKLGFHIVVRGEGEATFVELLKKLDEEEKIKLPYAIKGLADIKGLAFFDREGKYVFTGKRAAVELDNYPPFAEEHGLFGPIEITRGCPFICSFCQTGHIFGGFPRHRSIENILQYVKALKTRGLTDIKVITPNAFSYGSPDGKTLNFEALEQLMKGIKEIKPKGRLFMGSFPSEVRPEHVNEQTVDLILKYANNDNLIIGAQSGSPRMLDLCRRGHTVEDVERAVDITIKAGLTANVDFIFGLPGETEEDIKLSIEMIERLTQKGARIHAHTFIPLPQTGFAKAPSGTVDCQLRETLAQLIGNHQAYGYWQEHEKLGRKITRYLATGEM